MLRDPHFTEADAKAMQALAAGKASEDQQKTALKWILTEACAIWKDDPENEFEANKFAGMRRVGLWINKLIDPGAQAAARALAKKQPTRGQK